MLNVNKVTLQGKVDTVLERKDLGDGRWYVRFVVRTDTESGGTLLGHPIYNVAQILCDFIGKKDDAATIQIGMPLRVRGRIRCSRYLKNPAELEDAQSVEVGSLEQLALSESSVASMMLPRQVMELVSDDDGRLKAGEAMAMAERILSAVAKSNYIAFTSPAPSSTEASIRNGVLSCIDRIAYIKSLMR